MFAAPVAEEITDQLQPRHEGHTCSADADVSKIHVTRARHVRYARESWRDHAKQNWLERRRRC